MFISPQVFASEIFSRPILDCHEEKIGSVHDLIITPGETFPRVAALAIRHLGRGLRFLPIEEIELLRRESIITKKAKNKVSLVKRIEGAVFLKRDIIDKQIVDTRGFKIIRVNDLKLAKIGDDLRLLAADVGTSGLLRRLWLGGMHKKINSFLRRREPEVLIAWNYVQPLETDPAQLKLTVPLSLRKIRKLHPADIADIISQVRREEKFALFNILEPAQAAEALHELDRESQLQILEHIPAFKAADIFAIMPPDEAVDLLGHLPQEKSQELLELINKKDSATIKHLLSYNEKSAGGLMTTEFIALNSQLTAAEALERVKKAAGEPEIIYYLYVVDDQNILKGVLSLRQLLTADPAVRLAEIMNDKVIHVYAQQSQKKVANLISKYNFIALPVVDLQQRLLGIITFDDILDILVPTKKRRERLT